MVLEDAFENVSLGDNVQAAAGLEEFPISYRGGHHLRNPPKNLPENQRFFYRTEMDRLVGAED